MKKIRKLVASIVIAGMIFEMAPIRVFAVENTNVRPPEAHGPLPNSSQLQYHEEELAAFIHFGMNTFTGVEWGNGRENPNSFNPTDLNTDEWVRTLKDAGFKRIILVGKHHDGFALWKSEFTEHDVDSSTNWQAKMGGEGDVLEELSKSCTKYDMDMGIYLSPWDANATSYGYGSGTNEETDSNGDYNEYYMNQLREILGNDKYGNNGKFVEVWMDGAKGSGAAAQKYKFNEWFDLIEELQPGCLVFSPYGTTVRWIGNESGKAGDPVWSKINQKRVRDRYDQGRGEETSYLNGGDPNGDIWSVGECDVSLTSGWFWHSGNSPKSMEELTDIYFKSVGRGQPLLLNVAPDNRGRFTQNDINRIKEFSDAINNSLDENLAKPENATATASSIRGNSSEYSPNNVLDDDDDTYWTMDDGETIGSLTINLGGEKTFDAVSIEEYIKLGQRISQFSVDVFTNGQWREFGSGYTIGAKRLVRGNEVKATQIRINIRNSQAVPLIENVEVYKLDNSFELKSVVPAGTDFIDNVNFENKNSWTQESIGIGSTGMYSSSRGTHASFTFTGTKAWIVGTLDPGHGIMEVYIDGEKVADVDTYSSRRAISQVLYTTNDLPEGEHTIRIVVKGERNSAGNGNAIGLDCAYYLNNNGAGMFEIENNSYTVNEGDEKEITIKRVGGSKGPATVHFSTSPDSAVHGRHYLDVNKTIEFVEGQTTAKVSVSAIDNTEKSGNLKFYCNINDATNGAIIGLNKKTEVTIIDNDVDTPYTVENPFILPSALNNKKLLEAELFTLVPITGSNYVRIGNRDAASGGKMVTWFEPGNIIKVPFYASKAGIYTFNMSYESGRSEGNLNKINWSGTNIESGSKSVPGTGNQRPIPIIKTSFDVVVTNAGAGELVFTSDSQSSPNIDSFEVTAKELVETNHTITAVAGENGSITPAGSVVKKEGESQNFTFTPNVGYVVSDVLVDGASVGARNSYIIENIQKNTTIEVRFKVKEVNHQNSESNPIVLTGNEVLVEGENLELQGVGGEIENKAGASGGKVVGWLGRTSRGNAWVNMWVNTQSAGLYDIEVRYLSGANDILFYVNNDESISGSIDCPLTLPNFGTKTIRVSLKNGLDKIKFFNNDKSTANIDSIKITRIEEKVDKSELNEVVKNANKIDISKYTSNSLEKFSKALEIANSVVAKEDATQEEVNNVINSLMNSIDDLMEKANKEDLANLLEELKSIDLDKYTSESVGRFRDVMNRTEEIINDENATQESVDHIKLELLNEFEHLVIIVDKSKLSEVVENANKIETSKYTPNSLEKFNKALEIVNSVVAKEDATQEEVNNAINSLMNSIDNLIEKANKEDLINLLEEIKNIKLDKYTSKSVECLKAVTNEGENVIQDENVSQEIVDNIKSELSKAVGNLVEVNNEDNNNENDNDNNNPKSNNENTNNTSKKLPKTGSKLGNIYGILAVELSMLGAVLFRKKK